jgi:hypothetical protein
MKKIALILPLFLLSSCSPSLMDMRSNAEEWTIQPVMVLDWDESYPVDRWTYVFELDKPDTSINDVPFVLRERIAFRGDSLIKVYVLESSLEGAYNLVNSKGN